MRNALGWIVAGLALVALSAFVVEPFRTLAGIVSVWPLTFGFLLILICSDYPREG